MSQTSDDSLLASQTYNYRAIPADNAYHKKLAPVAKAN